MGRLLLAMVRPFGKLGVKALIVLGRLLAKVARMGTVAIAAAVLIFLLDMLLLDKGDERPE